MKAFRFDGDLVDAQGNYYIPDWAVKAHADRMMFFESLSMENPPDTLFVRCRSALIPVNVGDYIVQLPDEKTLVVLDKETMDKMYTPKI